MLDSLKDIRETLVDRIKNPFAGTFIFAWLLHNWLLVYSLLNFDSGTSLHSRTDFIENYIKTEGICKLLWLPVAYAFTAIILYLLFTNLSYAIFMLSTKWVKPKIHQIIDRNSLVLKTVYSSLQNSFIKVQKEKEAAMADLSKVVEERTALEKSDAALNVEIEELKKGNASLTENLKTREKTISEQTEQITSLKNSTAKELEIPDDIGSIFQGYWHNIHTYADGVVNEEFFTVQNMQYCILDSSGFKPMFNLDMVRIDKKLKLLHFRKVGIAPDNRKAENMLVFDDVNRLIGYEAEGTEIIYTKVDPDKVVIISAQYGADGKFVDVKEKVRGFIETNTEFKANNSLGGDPIPGKGKQLNILYLHKGNSKAFTAREYAVVKPENFT